MKILNSHKDILYIIFNNYLNEFLFSVKYYENLHDPEYRLNNGVSIDSKYNSAVERYENAKFTVNLNKQIIANGSNDLSIEKHQFLEAIKQSIREQMIFAHNHESNKYIVVRAYRKAIKFLQILNLNTDKYQHVTARYFIQGN